MQSPSPNTSQKTLVSSSIRCYNVYTASALGIVCPGALMRLFNAYGAHILCRARSCSFLPIGGLLKLGLRHITIAVTAREAHQLLLRARAVLAFL